MLLRWCTYSYSRHSPLWCESHLLFVFSRLYYLLTRIRTSRKSFLPSSVFLFPDVTPDTADASSTETITTTVFDRLQVQVRNSSNTVLTTLSTFSNLNETSGYTFRTFDLTALRGQTIRIYFLGPEDSSLATSFVIDDTSCTTQ